MHNFLLLHTLEKFLLYISVLMYHLHVEYDLKVVHECLMYVPIRNCEFGWYDSKLYANIRMQGMENCKLTSVISGDPVPTAH